MKIKYRSICGNANIYIGPPGVGKSSFKALHPGQFIDPEETINWTEIDRNYGLYPFDQLRPSGLAGSEHELDWSAIWSAEILPRIFLALCLQKDIIMGLVTPDNAEAVSRFLSSFSDRAKLILPDLEQHFSWASRDSSKRPMNWGSGFRSWKNTYWSRLLLNGLARELNLPIVDTPTRKEIDARQETYACRKSRDEHGRLFAETLNGHWALLNDQNEVEAMYRQLALGNFIELCHDAISKNCPGQTYRKATLTHDIDGQPLKDWIARDKLRPCSQQKKNAVIFFTGTLAPIHRGHLNLLDKARNFLLSEGWNVIGGYASVLTNRSTQRLGELNTMFAPISHRHTMLRLGALHSDWLMADRPIDHVLRSHLLDDGFHPCQTVMKRLRAYKALDPNIPITTFWVNGSDAHLDQNLFDHFARHANKDLANPLRMLVVENRPGENPWSPNNLCSSLPELATVTSNYSEIDENPTSATLVRDAILNADRFALQKALGLPAVESYLIGIVHKYIYERNEK